MVVAFQLCGVPVGELGTATVAHDTDTGIVKDVLGGDRDRFRLLVERYERAVFTLCLRMVRNRQDAEDCTQTAFVKAYAGLATFRPDSSFKKWIYRIASNACIDALRKSSRVAVSMDSDSVHTDLPERGPGPRERASLSELRDVMEAALRMLDDKYRLPLTLFHMEGLECKALRSLEVDVQVGKRCVHLNGCHLHRSPLPWQEKKGGAWPRPNQPMASLSRRPGHGGGQ